MTKIQQIPTLRFPEFSGEWEETLLNDVATFLKGKNISKNDIVKDGEIECIRYGELYTVYNEVINKIVSKTNLSKEDLIFSKSNDIIIPSSGESQLDIATASCVLKDNVALGGDLNIIRTNNNGVFVSFYLNNRKKKDIAALAQGNSVVHLYNHQLKGLKLNLPKLPEQQKIATFLTAVDSKIELLQKKKQGLEHYKKGVMQQLFTQQLRFKDEKGNNYPDWEEKKLGEIGTTLNGLTGKTKENFGTGKPYVQYKQIFDSSKIDVSKCDFVEIKVNETQTKVKYGDVFFTTSSETPNEIGTSSVLLDEVDEMYLNSFCFGFRVDSDILYPSFSQFLFRSLGFRKKMIPLAQGSTRYNISKSSFLKLLVDLPCIEEQTKIANFLGAIDAKIALVNTQLENTQQFKKGLLQQMFV